MYADPNYWWHAQEAKSVNLTGNNEEFILHKKYLPNVFKLVFEFKKNRLTDLSCRLKNCGDILPDGLLGDLDGVDHAVQPVAGPLHRTKLTAGYLGQLQELLLIPGQQKHV